MSFKDDPIIYLTRLMWTYSKGNRSSLILCTFLFFCSGIVAFFEPLIVAKLLNIIQEQGIHSGNIPTILGLLFLFILLVLGFWIFHGPARVIERKNAFMVEVNYKKSLIDGTMNLPMDWHTNHHSGNTIDKIEKGTVALEQYSGTTFEVIDTIMKLVGSYFALVYFNIHSAYIVAFVILITLHVIFTYDNKLRKQYRELNLADNRITEKVYDTISNITTVVILRLEKLASKQILQRMLAPFSIFKENAKLNEVKWFLVSLFGGIMMFLVLGTYIFKNYHAGLPILIGSLYALYGYVERIKDIFFRFAYRYGDIVRWKTAVENAEEISNEFKNEQTIKQINLNNNWQKISINNLSFNYAGDEGELHLNSISLSIKRNERIALVGESGSGKTTFLKLLRGLYKPKQVNLLVDNKHIQQGFNAIGSNILLLPQDPELFTTTIRENITMGGRYSDSQIKKYGNIACFTKIIKKLPRGLDSSIVEKGVNLSGGEKQRLALTRGLLASENKPILLLDEPTSSVDPKNELQIYKGIFSEFKNKTIISSIHRLHLLTHFDKIYLFKKGNIVARGTLTEVLKNGEFLKIWKKYTQKREMQEK
ncbi:hypothetical protein COV18_05140 [Candidatus Woesearchaeota archaeon CG10_big_fil_rev_8_21_14_0_10_37_12]|nr:MAG: hypothetical protein COV18_05140 [Candidatus Woesearchaeota archaeon CG10_big_fil_rev_8_21_14_0_10_37_12]